MEAGLLLILIIIGNLCLYWVLFGQKKFQQKITNENIKIGGEDGRETFNH